jgi:hypothetical protein
MELDALTQGRIAVACVVFVFVAWWLWSSFVDRRHRARFDALASALGATVSAESEFRWVFSLDVAGRMFQVERTHRGGAGSQNAGPGWLLITSTPLAGVADTHSATIRPKRLRSLPADARDADFAERFVIRDHGYPLRDGWLGERVRTAILHFYRQDLPLGTLDIEGGRLAHLMSVELTKLGPAALRELLERQAGVADALERAL